MCHPSRARRRAHESHHQNDEGCESPRADEQHRRDFGRWLRDFGDSFMRHPFHGPGGEDSEASSFGGRRPLRFLAHKLDLDKKQFTELARILDELKTERAQAAVDDRRTLADYADAMSGESFDTAKAGAGASRRAESVARVGSAIVKSLQQIHAILNPAQREQFAYLIRSGFLMA
jgi:Spy/CpxP family protein refolding chaperone